MARIMLDSIHRNTTDPAHDWMSTQARIHAKKAQSTNAEHQTNSFSKKKTNSKVVQFSMRWGYLQYHCICYICNLKLVKTPQSTMFGFQLLRHGVERVGPRTLRRLTKQVKSMMYVQYKVVKVGLPLGS
jgi:hypothetical protein